MWVPPGIQMYKVQRGSCKVNAVRSCFGKLPSTVDPSTVSAGCCPALIRLVSISSAHLDLEAERLCGVNLPFYGRAVGNADSLTRLPYAVALSAVFRISFTGAVTADHAHLSLIHI